MSGLNAFNSAKEPISLHTQGAATPHIDRVLEQRREKKSGEGSCKENHSPAYESRLKVLEQQLAELLKKSEEVSWLLM